MKKILFLLIGVIVIIFVGTQTLGQKITTTIKISSKNNQVLTTPSEKTTASFIIPTTLSIPKISITVPVESVGMDAKGRMDVPSDEDNVAWYNLGFKPGEKGSAVIDGHFDKASGEPAVFYKLSSLRAGDKITLTGDNGEQMAFTVLRLQYYDFDAFPLQEVFNTTDKPRLNLITCEGEWNKKTLNYSKRLVVYSELTSST